MRLAQTIILGIAGATTAIMLPASPATAQVAVLETDFGPANYFTNPPFPFTLFQLSISLKPSGEETKQFFIDSGLDVQMSNGQMISDVVTDAPPGWNPPHYNPLSFYSPNFNGIFTFGPATYPVNSDAIDTEALTAAVSAKAAGMDIIRIEILKRVNDTVTAVVTGEKEHFEFEASEANPDELVFSMMWKGIGFTADDWWDSTAQYAMRISAGNEIVQCFGDINGDETVNLFDLLDLLAAWGECAPPCASDLNEDQTVNLYDLLDLLAVWGDCL